MSVAAATAAVGIAASPLIWNTVARNEHRNRTMTWLLGGKKPAAYTMAAWIFFSSLFRDFLFHRAMLASPDPIATAPGTVKVLWACGAALLSTGTVFVTSSMWRLGVTGTYLGDYFGIYMDSMVTGFPFNVLTNPMYSGSTMCFLGHALINNNITGTCLAGWVFSVYQVALAFEGPFTSTIYSEIDKNKTKSQ